MGRGNESLFAASESNDQQKLTLSSNSSKSIHGHHLNKLQWPWDFDPTYQVSWKSVNRFQRRRFLKSF